MSLPFLLGLLGGREEAKAACSELSAHPEWLPSFPHNAQLFLAYGSGEIDDQKLLQGMKTSKWMKGWAHFVIALTHLADGDRHQAQDHFNACIAMRCLYDFPTDWSRAFLDRLKKDPAWPSWISQKP